jgi:L-threonylcarbamoyladenylate synthase
MQTGTDVGLAANLLKNGKLVVFPTETVYGLGANAFDAYAVARVFAVKKRPAFDPLIVHICDFKQIEQLFQSPVDEQVYVLAKAFWPGPLTIVHNKKPEVPDLVTSGLPTVAVRMPSHPVAAELIRMAGVPVAAPSANLFGCLSPTQANHVEKQLDEPDYLLDGGHTIYGIESTVVSVESGGVRILRHGAISEESLAAHIVILTENEVGKSGQLPSPGMLKSHYSPRKPLYIIKESNFGKINEESGVIIKSSQTKNNFDGIKTISLSENGNLSEIAVNLFAALHAMEDDPEVKQIFIESVSETGIGKAIMDRLRKASYNYL